MPHDATAPTQPPASDPPPSARALSDSLRRLEFDLDAERRFIRMASDELGTAARRAASPASSPEEAEHTTRFSRELGGTLASDLLSARERVTRLQRERHVVLTDMQRSGCFEGRWVADGAGAVYLRRAPGDGRGERLEVLRGPWALVKDAPPGDHPEETIRRGEILTANKRRAWETGALVFGTVGSWQLADLLLPGSWHLLVVFLMAVAGLLTLPVGARFLFEWAFLRERTAVRMAEARAAGEHLDLVRRGVADRPPLEELVAEARERARVRYRQKRGPTEQASPSARTKASPVSGARGADAAVAVEEADAESDTETFDERGGT